VGREIHLAPEARSRRIQNWFGLIWMPAKAPDRNGGYLAAGFRSQQDFFGETKNRWHLRNFLVIFAPKVE
jgi:hypothetical protein